MTRPDLLAIGGAAHRRRLRMRTPRAARTSASNVLYDRAVRFALGGPLCHIAPGAGAAIRLRRALVGSGHDHGGAGVPRRRCLRHVSPVFALRAWPFAMLDLQGV